MKSFRSTISIFVFMTLLVCIIPGCGSDKGLQSTDDTSTDTDTTTSTDTDISSSYIGDIAISASSYSISPGSTTAITATVYSLSGEPVPDVEVNFSLDMPTLASITSSSTTSSDGVAAATFQARSNSGSVVVSAYIGLVESKSPATIIILDGNSTAPVAIDLSSNPTSVLVEGTVTITANVWSDEEKTTPVPDGTTVAFGLANELYGTVSASSTTIGGKATATFEASNQAGFATIKATSGTATGSINIQILPSSAVAISFVSAEPDVIALEGSGGNEISTVKFIVKDSNDDPVFNMNVSVTLVGPNGGEYIDDSDITPNTIEVSTGLDGIASVRLHSGSVTGPATIFATIEVADSTMTAKSSVVSIGGGVPSFKRFSLASNLLNLPGLVFDNLEAVLTASLADRYGNYNILDGTTVSFVCEQGVAVDTSVVTANEEGLAVVNLRTQGFKPEPLVVREPYEEALYQHIVATYGVNDGFFGYPRDGLSSILAYTKGEEHFDDTNGNGVYDSGDFFDPRPVSQGGYDTPADPFIDYNDDDVYTGSGESDPEEIYINSGDDNYNGNWDEDKYIFKNIQILITGAPIVLFDKYSFDVANGGSDTVRLLVCDENLNPLSPGTTVAMSISEGKLSWKDYSFENNNSTSSVVTDRFGRKYAKYIEFIIDISDSDFEETSGARVADFNVSVNWEGRTTTYGFAGLMD